jgi:phosphatidylglycerol:prolipoprotein diacylglycerol transferase
MYNNLLTIGKFTIHGYGLMIGIGIICAYLLGERRAKTAGLDPDRIFSITIWAAVGGMLGAKILYLLTNFSAFLANPKDYLFGSSAGFVVYGGIIGGIFSGWLCTRIYRLPFWRYFDVVMPCIALAQGFGRIGCLLAGCCYGMEWHGPLAITFTHSDFAPNGIPLFPTEPVNSALDFLHCFVLIRASRYLRTPGQTGALYLMLYAAGRFVMEFFRGDTIRGFVGPLSTSQFISIFIFAAGALLFLLLPGTGAGKTLQTAETAKKAAAGTGEKTGAETAEKAAAGAGEKTGAETAEKAAWAGGDRS